MSESAETKSETLPDLDDLLQCPVCYEIPSGQIFQCNEGHHVCGRCKLRLDVCPVCRALFFGTRNYAMEELIANVKKLRAFKLGGKVTTAGTSSDTSNTVEDTSAEVENVESEDEESSLHFASRPAFRAPQACKGLFRCLCCKNGNAERLPAARLLNHLRYYHAPELIEGHSENGEYQQAWQFNTSPGRLVTAVRVADMGIFFLTIEIKNVSICAYLTMAASPWVANEFSYTITISGNDREAIFSHCVYSVRSCEGSLKKRGHCLIVNGLDAHALVSPSMISGKLSVRRFQADQLLSQPPQPRAVMRVASRGNTLDMTPASAAQDLEPFLEGLQQDVARLSRAFANLGREANALIRNEAEISARMENGSRASLLQSAPPVPEPVYPPPRSVPEPVYPPPRSVPEPVYPPPRSVPEPVYPPPRSVPLSGNARPPASLLQSAPPVPAPVFPPPRSVPLSRNARRRMRQRVRAALNAPQPPPDRTSTSSSQRSDGADVNRSTNQSAREPVETAFIGYAVVLDTSPQRPAASVQPQSSQSGTSNGLPHNNNQSRTNKKKRRQRR